MSENDRKNGCEGDWKTWLLGYGLGPVAALYGVIAALMGKAFLPGYYHAQGLMLEGKSGLVLACTYFLGGVYLIARYALEGRVKSLPAQNALYGLQNLLLVGFIASLIYVLVNVGTVQ
jgi:hypothetical protein